MRLCLCRGKNRSQKPDVVTAVGSSATNRFIMSNILFHLVYFVAPFLFFLLPSTCGLLAPAEATYNILMLLPFGSPSHRNCFLPLAQAMAERGHKVTILSALPPKNVHPNITEIKHGVEILNGTEKMFEIREQDPSGGFQFFILILPLLAREMYKNPDVMELYNSRKEFDLIIIDELFNEPAYPFLEGTHFATIAPAGIWAMSSATLGNVLNPSYVPSVHADYERPFSLLARIQGLLWQIVMAIYWTKISIYPAIQKELEAHFPNLQSLEEISKGLRLVLANTHFSLEYPIPILPSQVEVGGMHCRPGKPLPKNLKSFIDGAGPEGVVYFSLGSVCPGTALPEKFRNILVEAFGKLKQKVIWKFEEALPDLPENVMIQPWLPQQDILAHPNVKLFITHGGLLSMQESIYHSKPLLALPIFGDQEKNGQRIQNKGFGVYLIWEELTVDLVVSTIQELISNPKYSKQVEFASRSFRDQPMTPVEKAVWWTEYVIRHDGAPQLTSPGADLGWIQYLMIDVILCCHLLVFLLYRIAKKTISAILSLCSKSKEDKTVQKKKKKE